jgi:hypothetical protein
MFVLVKRWPTVADLQAEILPQQFNHTYLKTQGSFDFRL